MKWDGAIAASARWIGDDRAVLEWTKADEEASVRLVLRRRWLNQLERTGVAKVGQLRAMSEVQLQRIPNVGPKSGRGHRGGAGPDAAAG
jgi:DNA-directed RNA polymerase alpha subunit